LTFKRLLRSVNRGIVLAVVLLIGLSCYLVYDSFAFKKEKEYIISTVLNYAIESEKMSILPQSEIKAGEKPSDTAVKQKIEENKEIIAKYMTDSANPWGGSAQKYTASENESLFLDNSGSCSYLTDCNFEVNVTKLKKVGPDIAKGKISVKSTIKTIGNPRYIRLFWGAQANESNNEYRGDMYYKPGIFETEIDTEKHSYTSEGSFENVLFKKVNGVWKISDIGWYNW